MPSSTFNPFPSNFLPFWTHQLGQLHPTLCVCVSVGAPSTPHDVGLSRVSLVTDSLNKQNSLEFPSSFARETLRRCSCCLVSVEAKKCHKEIEDYHFHLELKKKKWNEGEKWNLTKCFLRGAHCPEAGACLSATLALEPGVMNGNCTSHFVCHKNKVVSMRPIQGN